MFLFVLCAQKINPVYCHLNVIDDSFGDIFNAYYHISRHHLNPINTAFDVFSITAIFPNLYPHTVCRDTVLNLHITVIVLR